MNRALNESYSYVNIKEINKLTCIPTKGNEGVRRYHFRGWWPRPVSKEITLLNLGTGIFFTTSLLDERIILLTCT